MPQRAPSTFPFFQVHHFCPNVPVVLVGTKKDLITGANSTQSKNDHNISNGNPKFQPRPVQASDAKLIAQKIGAVAYLECSAKLNEVLIF
jgi:hypothetical protein